jgi:hypothetical protein
MDKKRSSKLERIVRYSFLALCGICGAFGAKYPRVDVVFRISISYFPFIACVWVFRQWVKEKWFWSSLLPLLMLHAFLFFKFMSAVKEMNIWGLLSINAIECIVVFIVVARSSPEERAFRRSKHFGN